jgi:hypothetical protein
MKTFNLKIEKPCHENWDEMKIVGGGKFCSSCTKVVVDFSRMDKNAIADFFKNHKGKVCGNFKRSQLEEKYSINYKIPFSFNSTFVRVSLAGILVFSGIKVSGQNTNNKTTSVLVDNSGKTKNQIAKTSGINSTKNNSIKIKLKEKSTGRQLGYGALTITEIHKSLLADKNGVFTYQLPDSLADKTIHVSVDVVGYESQNITVNMKEQHDVLTVSLEPIEIMMKGEVMMIPEKDSAKKKLNCPK